MKKDPGDGRPGSDGAYVKAPIPNAGAVYIVAGSSGQTGIPVVPTTCSGVTPNPLDHPAMYTAALRLGSLVIDVDGTTMTVTFLDELGGVQDVFVIETHPDEGLTGDTTTLSVTQGGRQNLIMTPGSSFSGKTHLVLGSLGTSPGLSLGGFHLPLNFDSWFLTSISNPNTSLFDNTLGRVDVFGQAFAGIEFMGPTPPAWLGLTLYHAYVIVDIPGTGAITFTSNAHPLTFTY